MAALTQVHRSLITGAAVAAMAGAMLAVAPPASAAVSCSDGAGAAVAVDPAGRTVCEYMLASGTGAWTVPVAVRSVEAIAIGGGGGGGRATALPSAGSGGGGAAVVGIAYAVAAGDSLSLSVGSGGGVAAGGSATTVVGPHGTLTASGGLPGVTSSSTDAANGGVGAGGAGGPGSVDRSGTPMAFGGDGGVGLAPSDLGLPLFAGATGVYGGGGGGGAVMDRGYAIGGASVGSGDAVSGSGGAAYVSPTTLTVIQSPATAPGDGAYGAGGGGAAAWSTGRIGTPGASGAVLLRWVLAAPPSAPTIVSAVAASTSSIEVTVSLGTSDALHSDVRYSLDDGPPIATGLASDGTFTVSGLEPGREYEIRAFGESVAGLGAASPSVGQSPLATAPVFDADPTVAGQAWEGRALTVSSAATGTPAPATAYQWYSCTSSRAAGSAVPAGCTPIAGAEAPTYTVTSGDYGSHLLAAAHASNRGGGIVNTVTAFSATTDPAMRRPAAPVLRSVTPTGSTTAAVDAVLPRDTGGSPVTGVEYSLDDGLTWSSSGGAIGAFSLAGLEQGVEYRLRVRAATVVGVGPASQALSVTTFGASAAAGQPASSSSTSSGTSTLPTTADNDSARDLRARALHLPLALGDVEADLGDGHIAATAVVNGGSVTVRGAGWSLGIEHAAVLDGTRALRITGSGFRADDDVRIYLLDPALLLGEARSAADGSVAALLPIPAQIPLGARIVQVNGRDDLGEVRSVSVAVPSAPEAPGPSTTGGAVRIVFAARASQLSDRARGRIAAAAAAVPHGAAITISATVSKQSGASQLGLAKARLQQVRAGLRQYGHTGPIARVVATTTVLAGSAGRAARTRSRCGDWGSVRGRGGSLHAVGHTAPLWPPTR